MAKRIAKIEFEGGFAVVTQSAGGEVVIHWQGGYVESEEMLRTFDVDEAAAFIGGMVFSDHYADEDAA